MNPNQQHQTKINPASWRLLKQIAAHTGEKHYAVLERLLAKEWQRLSAETARKDVVCLPAPSDPSPWASS